MPLIVLTVAAGIALWSSKREARQTEEVRTHVVALCRDLAEGRDPSVHLVGTDPLLAKQLVERLRAIEQAAARDGRSVDVFASAGDAGATGTLPAAATHTAVIRDGSRDALVLRLVHAGGEGGIVIIGVWIP